MRLPRFEGLLRQGHPTLPYQTSGFVGLDIL